MCRDSPSEFRTLSPAVNQITELFCFRYCIASALPAKSPRTLGSHADFAISVFREQSTYCASVVFTFKIAALWHQSFRKKFALHQSAPSLQHNVVWNRFPAYHQVNVLPLILIADYFDNFCCAATVSPCALSLLHENLLYIASHAVIRTPRAAHQKLYFRQLLHRHLSHSFSIPLLLLQTEGFALCLSYRVLFHLARRFESLFAGQDTFAGRSLRILSAIASSSMFCDICANYISSSFGAHRYMRCRLDVLSVYSSLLAIATWSHSKPAGVVNIRTLPCSSESSSRPRHRYRHDTSLSVAISVAGIVMCAMRRNTFLLGFQAHRCQLRLHHSRPFNSSRPA